jgi:hypothetical protein
MALALFDRVQETTTTTGTGSVTLAGAVPGFQSFAVVGNGNTCYYTIVDGSAWEVGIGTYSTSGPTLARTTVLSNSSGNTSPITLAAGTKSIFLTYPAEKSVNLDASDNVSPLGTVSSGVWQGSTVGVAYGGTGVTASSGANSVVLRDGSQNIAVNRVNQSNTNTTAAGGTTALTAASSYIHTLVGTGGQTYTLPDATTLTTGVAFVFNNLATGTLTIANYAGTTIGTVPSGGAGAVFLTLNSTTGGTWDLHAYLPEGVTFGTNAFNLGTSIISGGTWQGGTIQTGYGGTGLTSYTSGGAVYANSSSTLTSGTLPVTAGGTGNTTGNSATTSQTNFSNLTIGGSQVLYAGNYNSYAPTLTGGGASGTWGINISGNAATATTAANYVPLAGGTMSGDLTVTRIRGVNSLILNSYTTVNPSSNVYLYSPPNDRDAWIWLDAADTGSNWGIYYRQIDSAVSGLPANSVGFIGGGTSALQAWISLANGSANFAGALTQAGNQVLHAGNYNSYAPTLTGTGATGTWAINITGSAGSAGSVDYANLTNKTGGTGTYTTSGDYRAPIFYDSDNTGRYLDPAGTSSLSVVKLTGNDNQLQIDTVTNGASGIFFQEVTANKWELFHAIGQLRFYNYTTAQQEAFFDNSGGYFQVRTSVRAPIFYDSNDTSFYVDPNSVSHLSQIYVGSGNGAVNQTGVIKEAGTTYGLGLFTWGDTAPIRIGGGSVVFQKESGASVDVNSTGTLTVTAPMGDTVPPFRILPSSSSGTFQWASTAISASLGGGQTMIHLFGNALNTGNSGYVGYKYVSAGNGGNFVSLGLYGNDNLLRVYNNSYTEASGSMRSPLFYDLDNTAYYCDPNSTSRLEVVRATVLEFGGSSSYAIRSDAWAGSGGYPGYSFTGGNSRFGFSSTGGAIDVYTDGNFYATNDYSGASRLVPVFDYNQGGGALYSSILYDNNNTAYYVDPNSTSVLYYMNLQRGSGGAGVDGVVAIKIAGFSNYDSLELGTQSNYDGFLRSYGNNLHYYSGHWRTTGNVSSEDHQHYWYTSKAGSANWSTWKMQLDQNAALLVTGSVYSPIFYDYNNTQYYLDPGATPLSLNVAGNIECTARSASWAEGIRINVPSAGTWGGIRWTRGASAGNWALGYTALDSTDDLIFYSGTTNTVRLRLDHSANLTASGNITAYSDERLKKDWALLPDDFLLRLAQVKSGTYTRIDSEERQVGVSAQGLREFLEEAVMTDAAGMLSVNYGSAALVSAVELAKYVTALEQRISQLEARL